MTQKRYRVNCLECGEIPADTDDGLYKEATAQRRAGFHEGITDDEHTCIVEVATETNEYRCPVCNKKCVGERERDDHARTEPGVKPDAFYRV